MVLAVLVAGIDPAETHLAIEEVPRVDPEEVRGLVRDVVERIPEGVGSAHVPISQGRALEVRGAGEVSGPHEVRLRLLEPAEAEAIPGAPVRFHGNREIIGGFRERRHQIALAPGNRHLVLISELPGARCVAPQGQGGEGLGIDLGRAALDRLPDYEVVVGLGVIPRLDVAAVVRQHVFPPAERSCREPLVLAVRRRTAFRRPDLEKGMPVVEPGILVKAAQGRGGNGWREDVLRERELFIRLIRCRRPHERLAGAQGGTVQFEVELALIMTAAGTFVRIHLPPMHAEDLLIFRRGVGTLDFHPFLPVHVEVDHGGVQLHVEVVRIPQDHAGIEMKPQAVRGGAAGDLCIVETEVIVEGALHQYRLQVRHRAVLVSDGAGQHAAAAAVGGFAEIGGGAVIRSIGGVPGALRPIPQQSEIRRDLREARGLPRIGRHGVRFGIAGTYQIVGIAYSEGEGISRPGIVDPAAAIQECREILLQTTIPDIHQ